MDSITILYSLPADLIPGVSSFCTGLLKKKLLIRGQPQSKEGWGSSVWAAFASQQVTAAPGPWGVMLRGAGMDWGTARLQTPWPLERCGSRETGLHPSTVLCSQMKRPASSSLAGRLGVKWSPLCSVTLHTRMGTSGRGREGQGWKGGKLWPV